MYLDFYLVSFKSFMVEISYMKNTNTPAIQLIGMDDEVYSYAIIKKDTSTIRIFGSKDKHQYNNIHITDDIGYNIEIHEVNSDNLYFHGSFNTHIIDCKINFLEVNGLNTELVNVQCKVFSSFVYQRTILIDTQSKIATCRVGRIDNFVSSGQLQAISATYIKSFTKAYYIENIDIFSDEAKWRPPNLLKKLINCPASHNYLLRECV